MSDLNELEMLVKAWREHAAANPADSQFSSSTYFSSALRACADQLSDAIDRMRGDE